MLNAEIETEWIHEPAGRDSFGVYYEEFWRRGHGTRTTPPEPSAFSIQPSALRVGDWMQTFTGIQFWPLDPRPEEIVIEDIAHALAMQCRFGGHCKIFYSVAEHCCNVSAVLEERDRPGRQRGRPDRAALVNSSTGTVALPLWGLIHDAAEAYLVDLPRPIKYQMPVYLAAEKQLMIAIALRFGLDLGVPPDEAGRKAWPTPLAVHEADDRMLMTEKRDLIDTSAFSLQPSAFPSWGITAKPYDDLRILPHSPMDAEFAFLSRFFELTGEKQK